MHYRKAANTKIFHTLIANGATSVQSTDHVLIEGHVHQMATTCSSTTTSKTWMERKQMLHVVPQQGSVQEIKNQIWKNAVYMVPR